MAHLVNNMKIQSWSRMYHLLRGTPRLGGDSYDSCMDLVSKLFLHVSNSPPSEFPMFLNLKFGLFITQISLLGKNRNSLKNNGVLGKLGQICPNYFKLK